MNRNGGNYIRDRQDDFIIPSIHSRGLIFSFITDPQTDSVNDRASGNFFRDKFDTSLCEVQFGGVVSESGFAGIGIGVISCVRAARDPKTPSQEYLPIYNLEARSLHNLGLHRRGVQLLEQVVKIRGTTLTEDHPSRLASQHALAGAYQANGQVKEAVKLLKQVVTIEETTLTEDHPDRLASQHALALAYKANGQVKEAVELLEQVVKTKGTTLTEDHPDRLASQHALALAYKANGQVKEAVKLLKQVVKIKQFKLRKDHPSRIVSEQALAYCLDQV